MSEREKEIAAKFRARPEFRRPLAFGDREQILALHQWTRALQESAPDPAGLGRYRIEYTVYARRVALVIAESEADAEELVQRADDDIDEIEAIEREETVAQTEKRRVLEDVTA